MTTVEIDRTSCELVHAFGPDRAIVRYEGTFVLVDRTGPTWNLSGQPASADEMLVLKPMVDSDPDKVSLRRDP